MELLFIRLQNYLFLRPENSMKKKHFNIPIFIPEAACPFQCLYCNQSKISGQLQIPDQNEIIKTIEEYLSTMPQEDVDVQLAYFGGNFTGLDIEEQENYLSIVKPYIDSGKISGIRLSTRPDYINNEILDLLKKHNVTSIELGAQSMDEKVLQLSKRGHTAFDTKNASRMIKDYEFELGLQMMIGLPGDTLEKSLYTAKRIVELGASNTRIYPTLVIKDTQLDKMYQEEEFKPLELDEAINWAKELVTIFEHGNVRILKLGLHPSENLISGDDLVAGPFHRSFRELVLTEIWSDILNPLMDNNNEEQIFIYVAPDQLNFAVGYQGKNRKILEEKYKSIKFRVDNSLKEREFKTSEIMI